MGSKTFDGVWFVAYSHDHLPPHVHGFYAEAEVLVELVNGTTRLAERSRPIRPPRAKKSDINHILRTATKRRAELMDLWRITNG